MSSPVRVVVWSTGWIGSLAIEAVTRRDDLELAGVWVHSADKVGRDAGQVIGGDPLGVTTTNDADALIALRPDCVVYAASAPERDEAAVPDYERLLRAGINVVTTTSTRLVFPPTFAPDWRERLEAAAEAGNATLYASGIFPGFGSDYLALVMATQSARIRQVRAAEISLNDHYPGTTVMMDGMGFGRPMDYSPWISRPGMIEASWTGPIHLIAAGLGVEVEQVHGTLDRFLTDRELHVACGTIPAGTVGAVCTRATGVVHGRDTIVIEHLIRMARDVAPEWPSSDSDATYQIEIDGDPDIRCTMTLGAQQGHRAGRAAMVATAMRVLNAVPYVITAPAGLLSSLDLPLTLPRNVVEA
jgi:2,4-diaminopentanoate dehydrogenase